MEIPVHLMKQLLAFQRNEITEHHIYRRLARSIKSSENAAVLEQIADDELHHYHGWKHYTGQEVRPDWWKVWKYTLIGRVLGFTFGVKLMERGEESAQSNYAQLAEIIPNIEQFIHDEDVHEEKLIAMLDEERLQYAGSVVLGLNDALVELTGALAGLTLPPLDGWTDFRVYPAQSRVEYTDPGAAKHLSDRSLRPDHRHRRFALDGRFRIPLHPLGGDRQTPRPGGGLHRHRLHHHGRSADSALPAPAQLLCRPGHLIDRRRLDHRGLQLLHFGRQR